MRLSVPALVLALLTSASLASMGACASADSVPTESADVSGDDEDGGVDGGDAGSGGSGGSSSGGSSSGGSSTGGSASGGKGGTAGSGGSAGKAGSGGTAGAAGKAGSGGAAGAAGAGGKAGAAGSAGAAGTGGSATCDHKGSGCEPPDSLGAIAGDTGNDVKTATGTKGGWYSVAVNEDANSSTDLKLTAALQVPAGMKYEVHLYWKKPTDSCPGSEIGMATADGSRAKWSDAFIEDDSRVVLVEVRYVSGDLCGDAAKWTLTVTGNKY